MNSIDAVLLRKAKEAGITDPRSPSAPQTILESDLRSEKPPRRMAFGNEGVVSLKPYSATTA
jgi:hypothetical protein